MKLFLITALILALPSGVIAQLTESFDIATYHVPKGWQKNNEFGHGVSYAITNNQDGSYGQIIVYQSTPGNGNASEDFKALWKELVVDTYQVPSQPELEPEVVSQGWTILAGSAPFEFSGSTSVAMLLTISDSRNCMGIVMLTNSDKYQSSLESFISSLSFKTASPPVVVQAKQEVTSSGGKPGTINGTWIRPSSVRSYMDDYKNPYSANSKGYQKDQYTFNSNGTYTYYSKTFKAVYDKLLFVRESGVYKLEGTSLTVTPQKSVLEVYSKKDGTDKWGKLEKTDSRPLEKTTYECFFHYFSGIQQWNLVLRHATETQRDGKFSGNTSYSNAWYFSGVSDNNPVIDLP